MATATTTRRKMTDSEARSFDGGRSLKAELLVAMALAERNANTPGFETCACEPYSSVFTFNRWIAQGMSVRKGERAIRHMAWIAIDGREVDDDADTAEDGSTEVQRRHLRPKVTFLFCHCQVQPSTPRKNGSR